MKKSSIKIIPPSESSKSLYRAFCQTEDYLPIFVQAWYLDAVCEKGYWEVVLVEIKGRIIASWPLFIKKKWGFTYVSMPHFVKWMGIYISPLYDNPKNELLFIEQILPYLTKVDSFKQNFHPSLKNWSSLYWKNFRQSTRYTYQIDLESPLEQIQQKFNRNISRNIKKAQSQLQVGYNLDAQTFYSINKMSFNRQNIDLPYSLALFKAHDQSIQQQHVGKIIYASNEEGNIVGVCYIIWDKQRSYYHIAGEQPAFRETGVGIFLTWKAIEFSKMELQVPIFDFEGSMLKGVAQIRQQFGGEVIPYNFIYKYNNNLYKLIDRIRS